jgi:hypothetical protein
VTHTIWQWITVHPHTSFAVFVVILLVLGAVGEYTAPKDAIEVLQDELNAERKARRGVQS